MYKNKKIISFTAARGGSKRFRGKNIHFLNGKPLISYPIDVAKKSKYIDRVIISTDDAQIARYAKEYGGEVPFMRPAELAQDTSHIVDAIAYTLKRLEKQENYIADYILIIQATTPIILPQQIDDAIELAIEREADSVITVCPVDTVNHPFNIRQIKENGTIKFWQDEIHYKYMDRPKPKFYHMGNLWLSSRKTILQDKKLEGAKNYPIIIDAVYSLDIDYKEDLDLIEAWLKYKKI